jgi:ankyrin repeat protein
MFQPITLSSSSSYRVRSCNALAGTHNANVEAADQYGWTALMLAAMKGYTATVNALAGTYNANVDAVDQNGKTALMWAAENGHTDTVNALRRHGATR